MNKRMFQQDFWLAIILAIGLLFIDYRYSLGIIVGYLFSIVNYKFIEYRYRNLEVVNKFTYLGSFVGIMILALPLLMAVLVPSLMHWAGVFIGLMLNRTRLIIEAFIKK